MEVTGPVTAFHNTLPHSLISSSVTFPDPDTDVRGCGYADVEVRGQFVVVGSVIPPCGFQGLISGPQTW